MVHKHTHLPITVTENRVETPGYRSLIFDRPQNFAFEAGYWIDIQFQGHAFQGGTTYSLASSPTEPALMITFKDGMSELKRALAEAKPGDTMTISQYGNDYKFTLNPTKSSTLIAGGVGIAPFRSMLQEMVDTKDRNRVNLIYLNQTEDFLYKPELDAWAKVLTGLRVTYITTRGLKSKERNKTLLAAIDSPDQSFYIAGPPGMVESTEHLLLDNGVTLANIKIDSFGGY